MLARTHAGVGQGISPGFDGPMDRKVPAPHMALIRRRMQQIAQLPAEVLARAHATLIHRPIAIHVFDAQRTGQPSGRARSLRSPRPGRPLHGLDVQFQHARRLQGAQRRDHRPVEDRVGRDGARSGVVGVPPPTLANLAGRPSSVLPGRPALPLPPPDCPVVATAVPQ